MNPTCMTLASGGIGAAAVALHGGLLLILLALSAAFSGSETVLFSLTRVQLERAAQSTNPLRRQIPRLMKRPKHALMTILVGNTSVNVLLFAVSYVFFRDLARQLGAWVTPVAGAGSVLLVVICGEVIPKVFGLRFAEHLAPLAATLVRGAGVVAGPAGTLIDAVLAEPFRRVVLGRSGRDEHMPHDLTPDELKALLQMSRRRGEIDSLENAFLREIVDLGATRVREVMVPRVEVVAYDINAPAEGLRELMRRTHLKKIPVYDGSIDNIVGLVYAKVLFLNPDAALRDVVMPVRFVPELATCEHLLHHFRQTKTQLAIVVDEHGGMAGLVTLEDVLEEIVGEISTPERKSAEPEITPLSDNEYQISGKLDVRYWLETFGLPPQHERVVTVGGLVTARLGRPARPGDVVRLANVELRVLSVHRQRIERLHLRLLTNPEPGAPPA